MQNLQNQNTSINQLYPQTGAISASDCISNGWALAGQEYGLFLGMTFLAWVILFVLGIIPLLSVFLTAIISGPLLAGIYYVFIKKMSGERIDFGMMFEGFQEFVPTMVVSIVQSIPWFLYFIVSLVITFAGVAAVVFGRGSSSADTALLSGLNFFQIAIFGICLLFSLIINICLFFALPLIVEYKLGAMDAIKLSAKAAGGNIGGLILLFILEFFILFAGALACIIGIFFVLPVIYAANVFAYRQVFPQVQTNFQSTPPPPTEYGNFGQGF